MLFEEKSLIMSSPAFFTALFRSPFFSLFFLGLFASPSFAGLLTFFASYRSSRVLWRALLSNISCFGMDETEEEVGVSERDANVFCLFRGRSASSPRVAISPCERDSLGACGFTSVGASSKELSEDLWCFLFLRGITPVRSSSTAG